MQQTLRPGVFYGDLQRSQTFGSVGLAESIYDPDTELPEHAHAQDHFVYVVDGSYHERLNGTPLRREQDALVFLPRNVPHAERHLTRGTHFMIDPPPHWQERLGITADLPLAHDAVPPQATLLARHLHRVFKDPDWVSPLRIEALVLDLALAYGGRRSTPRTRRRPSFLRDAVAIMETRFADPINAKELARHLGVHPVHLSRTFQHWYGAPVHAFLRELRLEFAYRELVHSKKRLIDIGEEAGFGNQSYFGRMFLETFGFSPRELRRRASQRDWPSIER